MLYRIVGCFQGAKFSHMTIHVEINLLIIIAKHGLLRIFLLVDFKKKKCNPNPD